MKLHYWFIKTLLYLILVLLYRFRNRKLYPIPSKGAMLVASNHASSWDPPILAATLPRELNFFAKKELFKFKPFGWLISKYNAFPVDRAQLAPSTMRTMMAKINEGNAVVMFPEGTRTKTGDFLPPKYGIGYVALKATVPVIILPVYIHNSKKFKLYKFWFNNLKAITGKPILPEEYSNLSQTKDNYQRVADMVMEQIIELKSKI
jgi:1-acyl-sn-glycerol-3-phosphate acyltransferase